MRPSGVALLVLLMLPAKARADEKADCVTAHEEGQVARREGRFDRAREAFAACQRDLCPAAVRSRCSQFARDLEAAKPTLVLVLRDAGGLDVSGARVSIDGKPPVDVSGIGLRLNPGNHTLAVTAPGLPPKEKTIRLSEGAKDMQVIVSLEPSRSASPVPIQREGGPKTATGAWAFAIAGGVSLVAAGALGGAGWVIHQNLKSSCGATGCSESQVAPLRILWPASFAALGVGVVSEALAVVLFAAHARQPTWSALLLASATGGVPF